MEPSSSQEKLLSICARCPLEKQLLDTDQRFRCNVAKTLDRTTAALASREPLRSDGYFIPDYIRESAFEYGTESVTEDIWKCTRSRLLGWCATGKLVLPDPKYL